MWTAFAPPTTWCVPPHRPLQNNHMSSSDGPTENWWLCASEENLSPQEQIFLIIWYKSVTFLGNLPCVCHHKHQLNHHEQCHPKLWDMLSFTCWRGYYIIQNLISNTIEYRYHSKTFLKLWNDKFVNCT